MIKVKTGCLAPKSGQYRPAGFKRVEITLTRGEKTPPYKGEARTFILEDATKHQKNK
ncbi:MAG TPA: hypothetical protein PLQ44_01725 [Candidatus Paceibacterota bacterium]|nr:hypothetical protein [Candidatus Paceibacterota bacterium]HPT40305.1 hypothetical protein [Candidatus Paceibacterota bacterium]